MFLIFSLVWFVLSVIGNWILFQKAGKPGWHSIIPILNYYDEYDMCWEASYGIIYAVAQIVLNWCNNSESTSMMISLIATAFSIVVLILHFMESMRLAKVFGRGKSMGVVLFLFGGIGRIFLGLSSDPYLGKAAAEEPF